MTRQARFHFVKEITKTSFTQLIRQHSG